MHKKGITTVVVIVIAVIILAVVLLGTNYSNRDETTGDATLTPGASYRYAGTNTKHIDCVYITEDDGWDVTKKATMQYYDKTEKKTVRVSDGCESDIDITEYDCDGTYIVKRYVVCPSDTKCEDGVCKK